jgi:PKD repeat protein
MTTFPIFILQPSDALRGIAETTSFSAIADAVPDATYAWSFDGTALINGGRISGADSTTLTINTLIPEDAGTYSIRAYNGILPDATADVLLTINNFPRFLLTDFVADFTNGVAPFFVDFTNLSTGWMTDSSVASFDWKFRDGSIDSTVKSPLHIFTKPGTYPISLKETRNFFSDTRLRLDYISLTSNSVNYYDNYPSRNDTTVISTIYLPVLFPMLSGDIYFTDETQIGRVNLYFRHEDGWQKKRIVHTGPDLTGSILWTSTAKTGIWFLEAIRVFDTDGAIHDFGRDNTSSDVIML